MREIAFDSAASIARRIARGEFSARDALEYFLDRQKRLHPSLNAIVATDIPKARRRAGAIDAALARGERPGPLAGVPMTVKESFDVAGLPTNWGLEAHRGNIAARDALVVERLRAAGAVVWGKSNVPVMLADWQTFNPVYGTTNSPWGEGLTPGGSSGGAASALAAGISALEYGSDIGGSIRGPSQLCGVYGHKTSYAIVPGRGHALPGFWSPPEISVVGPLARSAGDLALALKATAGPDGNDALAYRLSLPAPAFDGLRGLRIAVLPSHPATRVSRVVSDEIVALGRFLARQGARVKMPVALPFDAAEHDRLYVLLRRAATSMRAPQESPALRRSSMYASSRGMSLTFAAKNGLFGTCSSDSNGMASSPSCDMCPVKLTPWCSRSHFLATAPAPTIGAVRRAELRPPPRGSRRPYLCQ